jgi:hypothetical protein
VLCPVAGALSSLEFLMPATFARDDFPLVLGAENEAPKMSDAKLEPQLDNAHLRRIQGREWKAENG